MTKLILLVVIIGKKFAGIIDVEGYTSIIMIMLMGFGIIMLSIGVLGEYLWRTYDAARSRPPYIIEKVEKGDNSLEIALNKADVLLYKAKNCGKNQTKF